MILWVFKFNSIRYDRPHKWTRTVHWAWTLSACQIQKKNHFSDNNRRISTKKEKLNLGDAFFRIILKNPLWQRIVCTNFGLDSNVMIQKSLYHKCTLVVLLSKKPSYFKNFDSPRIFSPFLWVHPFNQNNWVQSKVS